MMTDPIEQFRDAIRAAGLTPPDVIEADGKLRRFASNGKRKDDAGWYLLHGDGIPAGSFGDWRTGQTQTWRADIGRAYTPTEEAEHRAKVDAMRRARDAEEAKRREEAASKALVIWKDGISARVDHPYLARKEVKPVSTLRELPIYRLAVLLGYTPKSKGEPLAGRVLIAPVKVDAKLSTAELIDETGRKSAIYGGAKAGGYWAAQHLPDGDGKGLTLLIGEGVATCLSAGEATGHPTIAALSAGNLLAVARTMRDRYPLAALVILADLVKGAGTPDPHAIEAARSVGGMLSVPQFAEGELIQGKQPTDMNDLAVLHTLNAVRRTIANAAAPAMDVPAPSAEFLPAAESAGQGWPEPMPLPTLPEVPAFPMELLPERLKGWCSDVSDRTRYAPDFPAVVVMTALGSLIGRKIGIRLKARDDWTEYGNVWGVIVGTPSVLKSPSIRDGTKPLKRLQATADHAHAEAMQTYMAEMEVTKLRNAAKKDAIKKKLRGDADADVSIDPYETPGAPVARAYWTTSATVEALSVMMENNPTGLLVERDELSAFLANLEQEQQAEARGFYLSGWSGKEAFRSDRIQRGTTFIPAYALSIIGGIQPGPLERYVRSTFAGERADGLLQRFQLAVWPEVPDFKYVDRWPDQTVSDEAWALFEYADTLKQETFAVKDGFGNDPPFVRLSDKAQGLFTEWFTTFMQQRRACEQEGGEHPALSAHFGKYPGLLGKLALILHVADAPGAREVSEVTLLKALGWLEYLEPHARRIYHAADAPHVDTARLLLARFRNGEVKSTFAARDIYRKHWSGLGDAKKVKEACRLFVDYGYLKEIEPIIQPFGRPADPDYLVHPALRGDA